MIIRKAEKKDIPKIAKLVKQVMEPQFKAVGQTFHDLDVFEQSLNESSEAMEVLAIAENDGKLAGFLHFYYDDNTAFIEDLVVAPEFRNKDFGKALMNYLVQECKKDKIKEMVSLLPFNSPGIDFAKKFGFKPVSIELRMKLS